jgi:hypothetical protein
MAQSFLLALLCFGGLLSSPGHNPHPDRALLAAPAATSAFRTGPGLPEPPKPVRPPAAKIGSFEPSPPVEPPAHDGG